MSGTLLTVTLAAALGQMPYGGGGSYTIPTGPTPTGPAYAAGMAGGPDVGGPPPVTATGGSNGYEQLYPFDAYENWMRGHFQDIPAYGGYHGFRPYNYKHVLSQSQVAGGWGMSPSMPYAHDYFRRAQGGITATRDPRLSQADSGLLNDLARLRSAQAGQALLTSPARSYYGSIAPTGADNAALRNIDSALHTLPPVRTDDLQEQLHRQALHLQALQNALPQEYQPGPTLRAP